MLNYTNSQATYERNLTLLITFAPSHTDDSCCGGITVTLCDNEDGRILHSSFLNLSKDTIQRTNDYWQPKNAYNTMNMMQFFKTTPDKPGRHAEPPHSTTVLYHSKSS